MLDFHSSVPIDRGLIQGPKSTKHQNSSLLFSARPNLRELPFLNKLKLIRQLLITLKNQKLRKSLYVVTEGCEKIEGQDILRHQKAKLSVMDLISEEGKFQELSNTIQSNINRQSISPIAKVQTQDEKKLTEEFPAGKEIQEPQKQHKKVKPHQKSTVLNRKNRIASDLNQLGHQLEETYLEVDELQKIFQALCNFYSDNRSIVDTNLKLKQQRDLIQEKIQEYQDKIFKNQRQEILLNDKMEDFLEWYKQKIAVYAKEVLNYNSQLGLIHGKVHVINSTNTSHEKVPQSQIFSNFSKQENRNDQSSDSQQKDVERKSFEINLKFKQIRSELQRIKQDKKTAAQNKNKQKKAKNESNQTNTFSKLYASEIYTL